MQLRDQLEAWKALALAYEVYIECAASMDAKGMAASLNAVNAARDVLIDAGLMSDEEVE
jgi:hypothetical protein